MKRIALTLLATAVCGFGQEVVEREIKIVAEQGAMASGAVTASPTGDVMYQRMELPPPPGGPGMGFAKFVNAEFSFDGTPIKGAPYSATTVNEIVQVLADGNRITHQNTGAVYRDSEGRVRREQSIQMVGPWSTGGDNVQTVFISDPVSGTNYTLDSASKTAHKLPAAPMHFVVKRDTPADASTEKAMMLKTQKVEAEMKAKMAGNTKTESLGRQTIEGVVADGTRTTITIPAGTMGNERDIVVENERWFSPDLQVVVQSSNKDPRMGTTSFKLQNVTRTEPAASLFTVPADYTVNSEPGQKFNIQVMHKPAQ